MSQTPAPTPSHQATVAASSRITPESTAEVRQIVLNLAEPAHYFPAGQNIGVLVPGPHEFGNRTHHRYYTIAASRETDNGCELEILVRRCFYIDEVSGEEYPGVASNYLCDARPGQEITLTGPHRSTFSVPADKTSNLLMLGTGTGIAPFRAFLRRVYETEKDWQGKVRLFYGARTGTDLLYMNDQNNDLANYYDQATFQAVQAVSKGLLSDEGDALGQGVEAHAAEIWQLVQDPRTHVYLAGMEKIVEKFDATMALAAGSAEAWAAARQRLQEENRWSQLLYQ